MSKDEVRGIIEQARERENRDRRFFAMLKGVRLDEHTSDDPVEQAKEAARQRMIAEEAGKRGVSEDEVRFEQLGVGLGYEEE